jgi:hypothetical protein
MEHVKPREEFLKPDPRWGDSLDGAALDGLYEYAGRLLLHGGVPEIVRSYFNSTVMLWLYGYLYYPFFATAANQSFLAVELALKRRFPELKDQTLQPLLEHAVKAGALSDDKYPSLPARRESARQLAMAAGYPPPEPEPYVPILAKTMPRIRNRWAHPKLHAIVTPGMAFDDLVLAQETINQLWPRPE